MAENIKTRKYYRMHNGTDWDRMHFVTDANSVDANDGDNMETKVGAIKGITTSTAVTEEGYAADATTVAALSSSLGNLKFAQDAEGNWGYIPSGADTVIPFSSGFGIELISDNITTIKTDKLERDGLRYTDTITIPDIGKYLLAICTYGDHTPGTLEKVYTDNTQFTACKTLALVETTTSNQQIKLQILCTSTGNYYYYMGTYVTYLKLD